MKTVYRAELFRPSELGSLGKASCMLICQHQFPHAYDEVLDKLISFDHDKIMEQQYAHGSGCFKKHTGTGDMGLAGWARRTSPEKILKFVRDILDADIRVEWTGFRILGTVHRGNGAPVWTLQLFAKHPKSKTLVYDTENAPNLIPGPRQEF
jgi:hypothetical protein